MSAATATRPVTSLPTSSVSHSSADLRKNTLRKNMSITQTYYLAHKARGKLSREAAQPDHDLRLLVGHANLLDSLMLELADAEREQERWFNQSVRQAAPKKQQERHIQWADRIEEAEEEYDEDSSSDSDSDSDFEDDVVMAEQNGAEDIMEDDLEEDYAQLELVRTPSHSNSPPELIDHDSESSDDDSMPPSPRSQETLSLDEKTAAKESEEQDSLYEEDYYRPEGLVSAISVY